MNIRHASRIRMKRTEKKAVSAALIEWFSRKMTNIKDWEESNSIFSPLFCGNFPAHTKYGENLHQQYVSHGELEPAFPIHHSEIRYLEYYLCTI